MVKKMWIIIGTIIFVLFIAVMIIWIFPKHYEAIAVADNLYFGMSPLEVRLQYGRPDETHKSTVSPEKTYIYHTDIDGLPAKLSITFIHTTMMYKLYRVDIIIDANETDAQETYNNSVEKCKNAYLCSDSLYEEVDANALSLSNSNGATGLSCEIWVKQNSVFITVIKTW